MTHSSDSKLQREMEPSVLENFAQRKGLLIENWKTTARDIFRIEDAWQQIEPDALFKISDNRYALAECYLRVSDLKPGNKGKIAKDIVKLVSAKEVICQSNSNITIDLIFICPEELKKTLSSGWFGRAVTKLVRIEYIQMSKQDIDELSKALIKQGLSNSRKY